MTFDPNNPITQDVIRDARLERPMPAPSWVRFVKPGPRIIRTQDVSGRTITYTVKAVTNYEGEGRVVLYEDSRKVAQVNTFGQEHTDNIFEKVVDVIHSNLGHGAAPRRTKVDLAPKKMPPPLRSPEAGPPTYRELVDDKGVTHRIIIPRGREQLAGWAARSAKSSEERADRLLRGELE